MTASLKSHSHGQTMVLTISNPEQRNALDLSMYAAGIEALNAAESSPEVRSVVIVGEGSHFCAGGNLQQLQDKRQQSAETQAQGIEGLHNWIETIRAFPKPVIAAVEGSAAGAGFSLALSCDLIVAAQNSIFLMAYSNVGLSPDGGASWSLLHNLPRATALQLMMLGERVDATRLQALGLVNQVSQPGEALADALALAARLNERAPNVMASIKELANDAPLAPLHTQLAAERDHFVRNLRHANAGEGITAFLEKHPPRFR